MDALATTTETKNIADFCADVVLRHRENWPPSEDALAQEFVEKFLPELPSSPKRITEIADRLGIKTSLRVLPDGMHGFNCSTEEETVILLSEQEAFPGSREHTFFHELREIMEYDFRDQGWATMRGSDAEKRAEQFATWMRMTLFAKDFGHLIEQAQGVKETWKRWLAFAGVVVLFLGVGLGYALLPYFEENFPRTR
ncbi:MAG TPA: hypothetical protein VKB26_08225 [Candidatus Acidoferrales bacterium]|nr:hypothetical protein [Candidatus Acidoferrales bacterium]